MAKSMQLHSTLQRLMGVDQVMKPIWQRDLTGPTARAASRPKMKYRPRGKTRPTELFQPAPELAIKPIPQTTTNAAPRKSVVAYAVIGGVGMALAGYILLTTTAQNDPASSTQSSPRPVPQLVLSGPIATPMPAALGPSDTAPKLPAANISAMPSPPTFVPLAFTRPSAIPPRPVTTSATPRLIPEPQIPALPTIISTAAQPIQQPTLTAPPTIAPLRFDDVDIEVFAAADTAEDVRAVLGTDGVRFNGSQIDIATRQVRFYRPQDATSAQILAARFDAALIDLTWFMPGSDTAKIDLFLTTHPTDD